MTDWVLDIETTTDFKTIRLCAMTDSLGGYHAAYNPTDMDHLMDALEEGDNLIMHNGTGFDIPMLSKYWFIDLWYVSQVIGFKIVDTLTIAKMLHPDIVGGNSLRAWGERMFPTDPSEHKGEVDYDKSELAELLDYCIQDCRVTHTLFKKLVDDLRASPGKYSHPLRVEYKVQEIVNRQLEDKVHFNVELGSSVLGKLIGAMTTIEMALEGVFPTLPLPPEKVKHPPVKQFLKGGGVSKAMLAYLHRNDCSPPMNVGEGWTTERGGIKYTLPLTAPLETTYKVRLGQTTELKAWLLSKGWKPTLWNTKKDPTTGKKVKTSPKLTDSVTKEPCPNLEKMGFKYGSLVAEWHMLRARKNLILSDNETGWLTKLDANDDLPSECDPLGTPTARFRHKGIANIPRITSPWGKELRSLFCARKGKVWVGWDASGLEARMEAHYTYPFDDGEYARELMDGDVHTKNQIALGLDSRDLAKTFKYAVTYGAQPARIAAQMGWPLAKAQAAYHTYWESNPALSQLKHALELEWAAMNSQYLVGLDGRLITTRYKHALLNSKFQGGGAVVMKHSMLIADKTIREKYKDAKGLIRYHDEEIWECHRSVADSVGMLGVDSIKLAGDFLKLQVPLDAEYKVGHSWADIH
jgi:DNA polymerase-1